VNDPNLEEAQTYPAAASSSTGAVTPSLLEQNEHLVSPKGEKKPKPVFFFFFFFSIFSYRKFGEI
jgi:hypothetical protein